MQVRCGESRCERSGAPKAEYSASPARATIAEIISKSLAVAFRQLLGLRAQIVSRALTVLHMDSNLRRLPADHGPRLQVPRHHIHRTGRQLYLWTASTEGAMIEP